MRKLATYAGLAGLLVTLALVAPVEALAPAPAGPTTTTRVDCTGGHGTVVVKQELLESGATRVVVVGRDVRNGRWRGGFAPNASSTPDEVEIDVTAVDHKFRTSFQVDDVTADTNMTLVQGFKRACAVGQILRPRTTSITSASAGVVVRHVGGKVSTAGLVTGCKNGTRWSYVLTLEFATSGSAESVDRLVCRKHAVRIPKSTTTEGGKVGAPHLVSLVARSGGDVVRLKYLASSSTQ